MENLFLTGATGYIGGSLLQKWLTSSSDQIIILARSKRDENPRARLMKALMELFPGGTAPESEKRIEIHDGDVTLPRLGLHESVYNDLTRRVTQIIHCAAAARFDLEIDEARKINVGGTAKMLDLARECTRLARFDYIGTAYVAGMRKGIIHENELDEAQEYRNTYERSKFEAERLVRSVMTELPITIMRPSIVICDSRTGRATSHNGFYRALCMYWQGMMEILPGSPSGILDLVPVDYVTDAIHSLAHNSRSIRNCYHLTAGFNNASTLEEIRDLAAHHFKREKFTIVPPDEFDRYIASIEDKLTEEARKLIEEIKLYMPYLMTDSHFDNANTVKDTGIDVPEVASYFEKMAGYIMTRG